MEGSCMVSIFEWRKLATNGLLIGNVVITSVVQQFTEEIPDMHNALRLPHPHLK